MEIPEKEAKMSHQILECPDCHFRFPTDYARLVHICDSSPKESDEKILAFLRKAKEKKKDE